MFSWGLQSRSPWRRWPHSTQISARWVTFSSLEKKNLIGQEFIVQFDQFALATTEVWAGALSLWKSIFSLPNGDVFSAIWHQISTIIWHSRALWPFCPSPGSQCRSDIVNPRKLWPSTFRPIGQSSPSSEHVRRVKSTVSTVPWSLMCTSHKTMQSLLQISLKQRQTLLWSGLTVALVWSKQTWHPSRRQLSHAQNFMQDMTHAVFLDA